MAIEIKFRSFGSLFVKTNVPHSATTHFSDNEISTCTGICGICYEHNCKIMDIEDYQTTRLKTIYYNNLDKVVLRIS